jgi:hypothetical protein
VPERELPSKHERITLKEAGERFDPPRSKKALEQMLQRGSLDFAREKNEQTGRTRRVVTTESWLEDYVENSGGKARLQDKAIAGAVVGTLYDRLPPSPVSAEDEPLRRLVETLAEENLLLKLRIAELESQLARR